MRWTCFEKRNFMGIELDVLVGHPEHELIFLGHQVAKAAGLADPARSLKQWRSTKEGHGSNFLTLKALIDETSIKAPEYVTSHGLTRAYRGTMAMLTESEAYTMLLRSNAPKTEPFRRWVTEEVLPTIRKTGSYNAAESSNPIAVGIMDELKLLRGELVELKEIVKALVYWT